MKPFNQKNYDQNDEFARKAVKNLFRIKWNIILEDNPDKYGIDLLGYYKGKYLYIEASKNNTQDWIDNSFYTHKLSPFKDISIFKRRLKYLKATYDNQYYYYCQTNKHGNLFALLRITEEILNSPTKRKTQTPLSEIYLQKDTALSVDTKHFNFYEI